MDEKPHIKKDRHGREYVDYTVLFDNMSDEELIDSFRAKDQLLHGKYCCHSVKDVRIFQELIRIMDERGLVYYSIPSRTAQNAVSLRLRRALCI